MNKKYLDLLPEKKRKELDARVKEIDEEFSFNASATFTCIKAIVFICILTLFLAPLWSMAYGPTGGELIVKALIKCARLIFLLIPFALLLDALIPLIGRLKIIKIEREYFDITVKPKVLKR